MSCSLPRKAKEEVRRTKVTLVFDVTHVYDVIGPDAGFLLTYARNRVEGADSSLVGLTYQTATIDPAGTILALTIIDRQFAEPGTEVSVVWGEHPGAGTSPDADLGFPRIRATVAPAPYDAHARTQYRRS